MWPARCRDITATVSIMAHKHNPGHTDVFVEILFEKKNVYSRL